MSDRKLSEELREYPYSLNTVGDSGRRMILYWADRAAALEAELERVSHLYAHWYDSFLKCTVEWEDENSKRLAIEAERNTYKQKLDNALYVLAQNEELYEENQALTAERDKLAAEHNTLLEHIRNTANDPNSRGAQNERLRQAFDSTFPHIDKDSYRFCSEIYDKMRDAFQGSGDDEPEDTTHYESTKKQGW